MQTAVDLGSVCAGKTVTYLWRETTGLLPPGMFNPAKPTLAIKASCLPLRRASGCLVLAWQPAGGLGWGQHVRMLPPSPLTAAQRPRSLTMQGPIAGIAGGDTLRFTFTAALDGGGSASAMLVLKAQEAEVLAVLAGPSGDVLDTQPLSFSAGGSLDPDDASNRTPFRYQWSCTAVDDALQVRAMGWAAHPEGRQLQAVLLLQKQQG